jgi:hypothetical protein
MIKIKGVTLSFKWVSGVSAAIKANTPVSILASIIGATLFLYLHSLYLLDFLFERSNSHLSIAIGGAITFFIMSLPFIRTKITRGINGYFRVLGWPPIIGLAVFTFWVLGVMIHINVWMIENVQINAFIDTFGEPSNFMMSYGPSSVDSLIFFYVVSIAFTLHSLKKPEDEKLSRKVEYIFPAVPPESKLAKHLLDKITELASINTLTERVITITDYDKKNGFIGLSLKTHTIIKNLHNNHSFSASNLKYNFSISVNKPNETVLGTINEVSIVDNLTGETKEKHLLDGRVVLNKDKMKYSLNYPLTLKPEQEVLYQTNVWAWEDIDELWTFGAERYTEKRKITIINQVKDIDLNILSWLAEESKATTADLKESSAKTTHLGKASTENIQMEANIITIVHNKVLPADVIALKIKITQHNTSGGTITASVNSGIEDEKMTIAT